MTNPFATNIRFKLLDYHWPTLKDLPRRPNETEQSFYCRRKGMAIDAAVREAQSLFVSNPNSKATDDLYDGRNIVLDIKSFAGDYLSFSDKQFPAWCKLLREGKFVYLIVYDQTDVHDEFEFIGWLSFAQMKEYNLHTISDFHGYFFRMEDVRTYVSETIPFDV